MSEDHTDLQGARILVVDDTPANLDVLCALLEAQAQFVPPPPVGMRSLVNLVIRPRVLIPAVVILVVAAVMIGRSLHLRSKVRWARETAVPEITRLCGELDFSGAFALAREAERRARLADTDREELRRRAEELRATSREQARKASRQAREQARELAERARQLAEEAEAERRTEEERRRPEEVE